MDTLETWWRAVEAAAELDGKPFHPEDQILCFCHSGMSVAVTAKDMADHFGPKPVAPYGRCPMCGSLGKSRERRPDGNDQCEKGHIYPSRLAIMS